MRLLWKKDDMISMVHANHTFAISFKAIMTGASELGGYWDDLGILQRVKRKSLYGELILKTLGSCDFDIATGRSK